MIKPLGIISLLFLFSIQISAQTVLTNSFAGQGPWEIKRIGSDMYVATWATLKLSKLNLDDLNDIETIADLSGNPWKLAYDSSNNDMYCFVFGGNSILKVDLGLSSPIVPINVQNVAVSEGMVINNNLLYNAENSSLYALDLDNGSYDLIYSEVDGNIRNPVLYNNELYFQVFDSDSNEIYKIDPLVSNPIKTLVSNSNTNGPLQSSLIVNDYLYLGFESPNKIIKLNLSEPNLPLTSSTLLENLDAGVIGLENRGEKIYYVTGEIIYEITDQSLSIIENTINKGFIYPNPVEKIITYIGNSSYDSYQIYSISGNLIIENNFKSQIDVRELSSGLYFILFSNKEKNEILKFLKK